MNKNQVILLLVITLMLCITMIICVWLYSDIFGRHIREGLVRLGMNIGQGLYNIQ